jgi:O-antigen/teichoic acid export membrane protein
MTAIAALPPIPAAEATKPHKSRLFSNSVAMGLANVLGRGVGYGYILLMARRLDARYLGAYGILLTASILIELISNLGLDKILTREITRGSANVGQGYFRTAIPIRLTLGVLSGVVAWTLLFAFFRGSLLASSLSIAIFLSAILPVVLSRNCEAFLTAHERMLPIAISQLAEKAVIFFAVLMLLSGVVTFGGLLCFAPVAAGVRLLITSGFVSRMWVRHLPSVQPALRKLLRQGVELFSVEILALVYFRSDVFMVAKMSGLGAVGIYQITYKIFDFCLSLFAGFLQAAFPRMVRNKSRSSLLLTLTIGPALLAIPAGIIILCRHMILGSFRQDYILGSTSLVWLMLTVPLVFISSTLANLAIAGGRVKTLIVLAALLIVANVSLNIILIPRFSFNGAAFTTFACELMSTIGLSVMTMLARSAE